MITKRIVPDHCYFAIPCFQYHGVEISNHNALLREMQGVDGIKTGYTEASGYNLVSSVRRDAGCVWRSLDCAGWLWRSLDCAGWAWRSLEGILACAATWLNANTTMTAAKPIVPTPQKLNTRIRPAYRAAFEDVRLGFCSTATGLKDCTNP